MYFERNVHKFYGVTQYGREVVVKYFGYTGNVMKIQEGNFFFRLIRSRENSGKISCRNFPYRKLNFPIEFFQGFFREIFVQIIAVFHAINFLVFDENQCN